MDTPDLLNLIRRAADDELSPDDRVRLDAHLEAHPEDRVRIEHERASRLSIARAIVESTPATPVGLADRVRAAIREDVDAETRVNPEPAVAGSIAPTATVRTFDWRSLRPSALAAGILLLISVAVLFSTLNIWNGQRDSNITVAERWADLSAIMDDTFGDAVLKPDASAFGYTFQNGEVKFPRPDRPFCHVTYEKRRQGVNDHSRFIIFEVELAGNGRALEPGVAYQLQSGDPSEGDPIQFIWHNGDLQYRLAFHDDDERALDIAVALGMPQGQPRLLAPGNDQ